jgi:hypothetical protein
VCHRAISSSLGEARTLDLRITQQAMRPTAPPPRWCLLVKLSLLIQPKERGHLTANHRVRASTLGDDHELPEDGNHPKSNTAR